MSRSEDLSAEDYIEFSKAKGFEPQCPLCRSKQWSFVQEKDEISLGFIEAGRNPEVKTDLKASFMLLIVCNNCAYAAPIHRSTFLKIRDGLKG